MQGLLPIYLNTLRKQRGLTQVELATLLSISSDALSRVEARERRPSIDVVLGSEVVFGNASRYVFPGLYGEIEDRVKAQARALYMRLERRTDVTAQEKLQVLKEVIDRANASDPRT